MCIAELTAKLTLRVLQAKVNEAGRKVPSVSDLAQGDAPTVPGREFTPPKSLDDQLGAAKVHTRPHNAAFTLQTQIICEGPPHCRAPASWSCPTR